MAAIVPGAFLPAWAISDERTFTISNALSKESTSAETNAENSPKLCPATAFALISFSLRNLSTIIE